jgi:hypothetical protein
MDWQRQKPYRLQETEEFNDYLQWAKENKEEILSQTISRRDFVKEANSTFVAIDELEKRMERQVNKNEDLILEISMKLDTKADAIYNYIYLLEKSIEKLELKVVELSNLTTKKG